MKSSQIEQAERRELAGSTSATTYRDLANLDTSLGGRFSGGGDVSGAEEATHYPRLPEGSPWACDPTGVEPPFGYAIDEQAPVGEAAEVAASLGPSLQGEDAASPASALGVEHSGALDLLDVMEVRK